MPFWFYALIAFVALDVALVVCVWWRRFKAKRFSQDQLQYIRAHWIRIIDSFDSHFKQGVMDADKLLDYALAKKGFVGTLGEKLKKAGSRFSDLNGVWQAHRLRNQIAHELKDINIHEARRALKSFKQGLNDLGANL